MTETAPTASTPAKQPIVDAVVEGYNQARNPQPAPAAPASGGTGVVNDLADKAKEGASVVGDALANPGATLDKAGKKIKGFWDSLTEGDGLGKILGGLIGLGGAWFLGNFFGEGMFSTILMVALAFPLMAIGSDKLGGLFNSWMGHGKAAGPEVARAPEVERAPAVARALEVTRLNPLVERNEQQGPELRTALSENDLNMILQGAKRSGASTETVRVGTDKDFIHASVAELRNGIAACSARGYAPALDIVRQGDGSVTPGCLPYPTPEYSRGRS